MLIWLVLFWNKRVHKDIGTQTIRVLVPSSPYFAQICLHTNTMHKYQGKLLSCLFPYTSLQQDAILNLEQWLCGLTVKLQCFKN